MNREPKSKERKKTFLSLLTLKSACVPRSDGERKIVEKMMCTNVSQRIMELSICCFKMLLKFFLLQA